MSRKQPARAVIVAGIVTVACLASTTSATTLVAIKQQTFVVLGADSKAVVSETGKPNSALVHSKLHYTGQIYFALAGCTTRSDDPLSSDLKLFNVAQVVADTVNDFDSFAVITEKVQKALQAALLKHMRDLKRVDPASYQLEIKGDGGLVKIYLASFQHGQPHFSTRVLTYIPSNPSRVDVTAQDNDPETGIITYDGPSSGPHKCEAARTLRPLAETRSKTTSRTTLTL